MGRARLRAAAFAAAAFLLLPLVAVVSTAGPAGGVTSYEVIIEVAFMYPPVGVMEYFTPGNQTSVQIPFGFSEWYIQVLASTGGSYVGPFATGYYQTLRAPNPIILAGSTVNGNSVSISYAYSQESLAYSEGGPGSPTLPVHVGPPPPPITCVVTSTTPGPPAQHQVTVHALNGLKAITNIKVKNGTVSVPPFTVDTANPVVITATKKHQKKETVWSFEVVDEHGLTQECV